MCIYLLRSPPKVDTGFKEANYRISDRSPCQKVEKPGSKVICHSFQYFCNYIQYEMIKVMPKFARMASTFGQIKLSLHSFALTKKHLQKAGTKVLSSGSEV